MVTFRIRSGNPSSGRWRCCTAAQSRGTSTALRRPPRLPEAPPEQHRPCMTSTCPTRLHPRSTPPRQQTCCSHQWGRIPRLPLKYCLIYAIGNLGCEVLKGLVVFICRRHCRPRSKLLFQGPTQECITYPPALLITPHHQSAMSGTGCQ